MDSRPDLYRINKAASQLDLSQNIEANLARIVIYLNKFFTCYSIEDDSKSNKRRKQKEGFDIFQIEHFQISMDLFENLAILHPMINWDQVLRCKHLCADSSHLLFNRICLRSNGQMGTHS